MGIRLIQVPYDSGFRDRRMGLGPARPVDGGAVARLAAQGGPVETVLVESDEPLALEIALAFELQRRVAAQVRRAALDGDFPLVFAR